MRLLLIVFASAWIYLPSTVLGVIDPDTDQVGVYFDLDGNTNAIEVEPGVPFNAYVLITRPSAPVHGYFFSYRLEVTPGSEDQVFRLANTLPAGDDNFSDCTSTDKMFGCYNVGLSSPLPVGDTVVAVGWQYMTLTFLAIDFYLGPVDPSIYAGESPAYEIGGGLSVLGISSGSADLPVARVNGLAPVGVQSVTFGSIKATFR